MNGETSVVNKCQSLNVMNTKDPANWAVNTRTGESTIND